MNKELKDEKCLLKTELNESKKSEGSEALDRQTVDKKSFSDRFCDDLSEVILQYLSLEDKLRLQCVSKQFQRTVFQRQYELYINVLSPDEHKMYLKYKNLKKRYQNYYYIEDQSMQSFKALLKKCPNITSIESDDYNPDNNSKVFQLLIENCNNLSEVFSSSFITLNESEFEKFHQKFGPKIKYFRFHIKLSDFSRFPNIEKIESIIDESIIPQMTLAKLKQLELIICQGQEHMLHAIIENFPKLTHLELFFHSVDENAVYESLKSI